ncbi:MAG: single-stranded DNA-binding protein [Ruminococcus sp.]
MINKAVIMGRIANDLQLKETTSGRKVMSFNVAVDIFAKAGEEPKTDFIPVVCWQNTAEFVHKYFQKGSMIAIDGSLQMRTYETSEGYMRNVLEIIANEVSFAGERKE